MQRLNPGHPNKVDYYASSCLLFPNAFLFGSNKPTAFAVSFFFSISVLRRFDFCRNLFWWIKTHLHSAVYGKNHPLYFMFLLSWHLISSSPICCTFRSLFFISCFLQHIFPLPNFGHLILFFALIGRCNQKLDVTAFVTADVTAIRWFFLYRCRSQGAHSTCSRGQCIPRAVNGSKPSFGFHISHFQGSHVCFAYPYLSFLYLSFILHFPDLHFQWHNPKDEN